MANIFIFSVFVSILTVSSARSYWPTPFKQNISLSNFVCDFYEQEVYIFDSTNRIRKIRLDNEEEIGTYNLPQTLSGKQIVGPSFDWVTKNLYFFVDRNLKLIKLAGSQNDLRGILTLKKDLNPRIVKVSPNDGYVVVKTDDGELTRFDQDGSNSLILYNSDNSNITAIAVDHNEETVYWLEKNYFENKLEIKYVNLNGGQVKNFNFTYDTLSYSSVEPYLALDEDYIYFIAISAKASNHHLQRISKEKQVYDEKFDVSKNPEEFWFNYFLVYLTMYGQKPNSGSEVLRNLKK